MARTKQTARRSGDDANAAHDEEDLQEINGHLTEEEKQRRAELEKMPMQAELKNLEKRWTKKGRGYITEPKDDDDVPEDSVNWYEQFALCITRQYDNQNKYVCQTSLQINSSSLKGLLKDVIETYPGISFQTTNISINSPYHCLYHYRVEFLDKLEKTSPGSELGRHLPILLKFLEEEFVDTLTETNNLNPQGLCSYGTMWTLFRPGIKIFSRLGGQNRAFKLNSYQYASDRCGEYLALNVDFIDYDGDDFGTRQTTLRVPKFSGAAPVTGLNAFPLARHPNALDISKRLIARGKKWEEINSAGQSFMDYKGIAVKSTCPRGKHNIDCRVMIDADTYHRIEADDAFNVNPLPLTEAQKAKATLLQNDPLVISMTNGNKDLLFVDREPLTDEQRLMATPMMLGFSFTEKLFLEFFVDALTPIEWNTSCFEQLVLPTSQKELVQALVAEHTQRQSHQGGKGFDDIVKNKGLGLILVLHGPPGVGKTLTAECVAEFSKRPLYIVSSGDLGTTASALDNKLSRILDLASTWKAVLLIDEADVFLERRSLNDMERNSLVSIFLRTLEYYSGILFMTTNRVRTFDDAFKSRIHVPLKYDELPHSSRVTIWRNFLDRVRRTDPAAEGGIEVDVDENGYQKLAESPLNGRQIKNVVRTAKSLAGYRGGKLDVEALLRVVEIQMAFEEELGKAKSDGMEIDEVEK
ncbi:hypothetical protein LTR70_010080 [Exophiala xenobiotica]|uniref:AAA+ ATPase domain-containing protein n=1 Tax=Lithohypha guttulata TaxID=1690604 RepID=A0ABR0JV89_9EURO|nr:hypothetical protein LTR24_010014 [Lithohypha guttulata]KAK5309683.1 hypothetical protein LTR70_010080 [Exophiala xenobiotica]